MKHLIALFLTIIVLGSGCSANQPATPKPANNPTNDTPPAQQVPTSGVELDLSNRGLTEIPWDVFSRTDLEQLNLSKNSLTGAPQSQIGQLKNLKSLDLSNNALTGLPSELGQLANLETLNVSNNKLTGLPMELGNLTQLRVLDVSGNAYSTQDLDQIAAKLTKTEIRR